MKIRRRSILAGLVGGVVIVYLLIAVRDQIRRAKTYDTLAKIDLTASKTLYLTNWQKGYNLVLETKREFPGIKIANASILDEWENPIRIRITTNRNEFEILIESSGKDGKFGTPDDLTRRVAFNLLEAP